MPLEAGRIDELHELTSWNSPPVLQLPQVRLLSDSMSSREARELKFKDKSVDHLYGTDQSSLPGLGSDLRAFGTWPSVASTIWNKLLQMTSYDPSNVDYNGSVFAAFKTKFSTAPYWNGLEFNIQHDGSSLPPLGQDLHIFGNWPAVASTLHRRLYYTSGLDPASGLYSGDLFAKFRYLFSTSPFWNIHFNIVTREVKVKNSSFRPVVEAIRAYCESAEIAPAAGREIASNLGYGLHLALHQGEMAQKRTLLQNSMIAITDGMLHVTLVYAMLEMKRPQQGQGYRVLAQDTQLVIGDGVLDYAFCKRHANSILAYDSTDIGDWKAMAAANRWEYTVCDDDSRDVAVPRP